MDNLCIYSTDIYTTQTLHKKFKKIFMQFKEQNMYTGANSIQCFVKPCGVIHCHKDSAKQHHPRLRRPELLVHFASGTNGDRNEESKCENMLQYQWHKAGTHETCHAFAFQLWCVTSQPGTAAVQMYCMPFWWHTFPTLCKILYSLPLSWDSRNGIGWEEGTDAIIALVDGKTERAKIVRLLWWHQLTSPPVHTHTLIINLWIPRGLIAAEML